jgi:hypothetical protein
MTGGNMALAAIGPHSVNSGSAILLILAGAAWAQPPKLNPLPIALPKPLFEGTPRNLKVANLEKMSDKPRPPFLAPAGTTNVARGRPVTSSVLDPAVGDLEMITDGEKSGLDGTYVELGPGVQWVAIDLKQKCTLYAVAVWHYHKQARVYSDVIVQVADDADFLTNVRTIFNNDPDNAAGMGIGHDQNYVETYEGKLIDAKGIIGRYIRLFSNGNDTTALNHYVEVEAYGIPLK